MWTLFSSDEGNSFTEPQILFPGSGSYDRNRIILDLQNNWVPSLFHALLVTNYHQLFPLYNESIGDGAAVLGTLAFEESVLPGSNWNLADFPKADGLVQPTIIRPVPGT